MSKIKNGGLNQYGKVWSPNGIGGERVNGHALNGLQPLCLRLGQSRPRMPQGQGIFKYLSNYTVTDSFHLMMRTKNQTVAFHARCSYPCPYLGGGEAG